MLGYYYDDGGPVFLGLLQFCFADTDYGWPHWLGLWWLTILLLQAGLPHFKLAPAILTFFDLATRAPCLCLYGLLYEALATLTYWSWRVRIFGRGCFVLFVFGLL